MTRRLPALLMRLPPGGAPAAPAPAESLAALRAAGYAVDLASVHAFLDAGRARRACPSPRQEPPMTELQRLLQDLPQNPALQASLAAPGLTLEQGLAAAQAAGYAVDAGEAQRLLAAREGELSAEELDRLSAGDLLDQPMFNK